jgi:hypothetical protein
MASAAATALGEIQAAMIIARQFPRDMATIQAKCLAEAKLSGDLFFYHWDVSSKDQETGEERRSVIEGPSIDLALSAIRNFGNAHVRQRPMVETPSAFIFTAAVIDYETGFTYERQFRQDKNWTVYGRMDKFRKEDIRFQIGQSKASRNAILNFLPAGLIDRMMEAAKGSVREQIEQRIKRESIEKVRIQILEALVKLGATQEMIEERLGLELDDWDAETLTMLTGDLRAIKRGTETVNSLYASVEAETETKRSPSTGTLDINAMEPGDPATHQGHPAVPQKAEPEKTPEEEKDLPTLDELKAKLGEPIAIVHLQKPTPEIPDEVSDKERKELMAELKRRHETGLMSFSAYKELKGLPEQCRTRKDFETLALKIDAKTKKKK